jgi:hypothetical protein
MGTLMENYALQPLAENIQLPTVPDLSELVLALADTTNLPLTLAE